MAKPAAPASPRLDARKEPESQALRKDVLRELARLQRQINLLRVAVNDIDVAAGNAPIGAPYVTTAASGALTNERIITAGNGIDLTDGGAGGPLTIDVDESELALQAPQYLTLANTTALPNERAFTVGHGLDATDAGAGSTYTLDVDETELNGSLITGMTVPQVNLANVYEDTDWAALATNAFTDGTETVNGVNHTVVQTALVGSWGMVNGSGFVYTIPNNLARTWTLASLTTAPYFYRALSTVPNIDYGRPFIIDVHLTGQVYENGNDAIRVGLWEPAATPYAASTARVRMIDRGNFGPGTSTLRTFDGTTPATQPEAFAPDCIRIVIYPSGWMFNYYGTWSAGWPTVWHTANNLQTAINAVNSWSDAARITFVFINSADATPTTTTTIANVRYSGGY